MYGNGLVDGCRDRRMDEWMDMWRNGSLDKNVFLVYLTASCPGKTVQG